MTPKSVSRRCVALLRALWRGVAIRVLGAKPPPLQLEVPHCKEEKECNDMNADIENFISYYVNLTDSHAPGYAVLVNGEWGSGKTYLVKKVLEKAGAKYLYVSLYGMSSLEEVGDALFQQLHPVLGSKAMRVASMLGKSFLRGSIKIDLDGDGKVDGSMAPQLSAMSLSKSFQNAGDKILIFDDVERSHISVANVLGYINSFVEHEDCKAILIAHESEIQGDDDNAYTRVKEKLIGKTLRVTADFTSALGNFFSLIDDDRLRDYYELKRETIGELFRKSGTNNLRILKATLWGFERFAGCVTDKQRQHDELMETLMTVFFVLSFELKVGRLKEDELRTFQAHSWLNVNPEKEARAAIEERYPGVLSNDSILNYQTWARILVDGAINRAEIQAELSQHPLLAAASEPSWRVLWVGHGTEQEIDAAIESLEKDFLSRSYSKVGELFHVFGIRLWLARIGAIPPKTVEDIVEEAKLYIDDLLAEERLPRLDADETPIEFGAWSGLYFKEQESPEFGEIRKYVEERQEVASEAFRKNDSQRVADMMTSNADLFYLRLCHTNSKGNLYARTPILHFLDPKTFAEAVLALPHSNLATALVTFKTRYDPAGQISRLEPELPWLAEVDTILRTAAEGLKPVQKDLLLRLINRYFRPALTQYQKLKEQAARTE